MHTTGQSVVIRHKEYLAEISGSKAFKQSRFFLLQPGDTNTFPWLNGIATKFQQYRIKGMVFHYVPSSGVAVSGTNAALGTVMIQTSYRANDSDPASKVEMLNEYWSSESAPNEAFCHPIECDPKENPFAIHYVRTDAITGSDSPLMYDLGKTWIYTSGQQADGTVLGDLWVTYEIELLKPVISSSVTGGSNALVQSLLPTTSSWFPASGLTISGNLSEIRVSPANVITFPIGLLGTYMVSVDINAATTFTAMDLSGAPTLTNCTLQNMTTTASYMRTVMAGATATLGRGFYIFVVVLSDPSVAATATLPTVTWTGSAATADLFISRYG
jgi:hypothetical protein